MSTNAMVLQMKKNRKQVREGRKWEEGKTRRKEGRKEGIKEGREERIKV